MSRFFGLVSSMKHRIWFHFSLGWFLFVLLEVAVVIIDKLIDICMINMDWKGNVNEECAILIHYCQ